MVVTDNRQSRSLNADDDTAKKAFLEGEKEDERE